MALLALTAAALTAQPVVTSLTPARHDLDAALNTDLTAGFSAAMDAPASGTFRVRSNLRGWLGGSFSGGGTNSLTFDPASDLLPGEEIEVMLTTGLQSTGGASPAAGHNWRFRAKTSQGPSVFTNAQHATGTFMGWDLEFGDLDNDGDLDAVVINNGQSYLLFNDGSGAFSATILGANNLGSYHCALADVESDGDLDVIVVGSPIVAQSGNLSGQNLIYLNDGNGNFANTVNFGSGSDYSNDVEVGDLDGDGDLYFVVAYGAVSDEPNDIYINDGSGNFTRRGFLYIASSTAEIADTSWVVRFADVDNDGDLDVFIGNFGFGPVQSYYYLNDGAANFYYTGRIDLGAAAIATSLAMGDFNGDGHVDVAVGHLGQPYSSPSTYDRVSLYLNNGSGAFGTPLVLSAPETPYGLEAGDIDGDGDLDLAVGFGGANSYVMLNQGNGQFAGTVSLGTAAHSIAFADLDGDGDLDAGTPDKICINGSNAPVLTLSAGGSNIPNGGTLNVNYNDTLASLNLQIGVDDANQDYVSLSASISNIPTQGIQVSEFSHATALVAYGVYPTSGVFNQGGVTHQVMLTASDGSEATQFSFSIVVGAAPAPSMQVCESAQGGASIGNGANASGGRDFGSQLVTAGPTAALTVVISNSGNADLDVTGVSLSGSDAAHFVLNTGGMAGAVAPSGFTQFTVAFDPATAGSKTATIEIAHNDASTSTPYTFQVTGVGTTPAPVALIVVREGGVVVANGAGSRNFGSLIVGSPSAPFTITVENAGNADLVLGTPGLSGAGAGQFSIDHTGMLASVPAGQSTSFTLTFLAGAEGTFGASVSFSHNDSSTTTPFSFNVTGTATTATGSGGGSGGSGGGCAAGSGSSLLGLLFLLGLGAIAVTRRRGNRA
jgi:hypothetical protein